MFSVIFQPNWLQMCWYSESVTARCICGQIVVKIQLQQSLQMILHVRRYYDLFSEYSSTKIRMIFEGSDSIRISQYELILLLFFRFEQEDDNKRRFSKKKDKKLQELVCLPFLAMAL